MKNPIKDINSLLAAGVKEIVILDIQSKVVNLVKVKLGEKFYNIFNKKDNYNYSIEEIKSFNYSGEITSIRGMLSGYIASQNKEIYLVIGINEYKFHYLQIPVEIDDIDVWLLENSEKFYPSKKNQNDFKSGYEIIREDENYRYGYLVVARVDFISKIEITCNNPLVNLIRITPLTLSFILSGNNQIHNKLFLDFKDDRIGYVFQKEDGHFYDGELFYKNTYNVYPEDNIIESLNEINKIVQEGNESRGKEIKDVFVSCPDEIYRKTKPIIHKLFEGADINPKGIASTNVLFAVFIKKLLNNYEGIIDFRTEEVYNQQKEKFEKNFVLRFVLGFGLFFLTLLIIIFFAKNYLLRQINYQEEVLTSKHTNSFALEKLKKENIRLTSNYKLINSLRNDKSAYDDVLLKLSKIINSRSRLTDLELKDKNDSSMSIILKGLAYEQVDVAALIKNLENDSHFTNITLLYSDKVNSENVNQDSNTSLVQFQISADYIEN